MLLSHNCIKTVKNTEFTQKKLDHLLLMTSSLVIIVTDSRQTRVKTCLRDMRTTTEDDLGKIEEKPYGPPPPPPSLVRPRVKTRENKYE